MTYIDYPTNVTGITSLFQYVDKVTCADRSSSAAINACAQGGGLFGIFTLIGMFFVMFMVLKVWGSEKAFTVASFFVMMMSWIFLIIHIVPNVAVVITTIMFVSSIFFLSRQQ